MLEMFKKENPEMKFAKEQGEEDREHSRSVETFRATAQDDQTALMMQQERTDLLKWQQDLDPELQKLIHNLRNEVLINDIWVRRSYTKDGKIHYVRPICNEKFIQEIIIPQCSPFLDRNIINTWYEEKDILDTLRNTCDDLVDTMADHYDEYGIDFTDYDNVLRNIKNVIRPGIYRCLKGFTKKIDSTIIRRVEQSSENPNLKDKKGFSKLMGG